MKRNRTPLQENPLTEYEKKRQEQILKNQEFLISLGLTSPSVAIPSLLPSRQAKRRRFSSSSSSSSSSSLDSSSANDCEDLQKGDEKGEKEKEELLSVWSSRLRSRRTRDETHSIEKTEKSTPSQKQKNKTKERPKITTDAGEKMSLERSNQKSDFSRNLFCDLGRLKQNLGIPFSSFGKQAAMNISSQCGTSPRFNKYRLNFVHSFSFSFFELTKVSCFCSGVTEWKNAIFLWVNFPESPEEANYDNAIWRAQKVEDSEATSKWSYFISWFSGKSLNVYFLLCERFFFLNM